MFNESVTVIYIFITITYSMEGNHSIEQYVHDYYQIFKDGSEMNKVTSKIILVVKRKLYLMSPNRLSFVFLV